DEDDDDDPLAIPKDSPVLGNSRPLAAAASGGRGLGNAGLLYVSHRMLSISAVAASSSKPLLPRSVWGNVARQGWSSDSPKRVIRPPPKGGFAMSGRVRKSNSSFPLPGCPVVLGRCKWPGRGRIGR